MLALSSMRWLISALGEEDLKPPVGSITQGNTGRTKDVDFQESVRVMSSHSLLPHPPISDLRTARGDLAFDLPRAPFLEKGPVGELERAQLSVTCLGR